MYVDDNMVLLDNQSLSGSASVTSSSYDMGESVVPGMFDLNFVVSLSSDAAGPTTATITVETSDDNSTWTEVTSHTVPHANLVGSTFALQAPLRRSRYVRLKVAGDVSWTAGTAFASFQGFGKPVRTVYGS